MIGAAAAHFQELLKVRAQSPLLRLRSRADVKKRVDFLNTGKPADVVPGLIVMTVTDGTGCGLPDLDPQRDSMVVLINADKQAHDFKVAGATGFTLHAVQQASADPIVKTASFGAGVFHVPARTSAVFEQLQGAAQGTGLPCNTHGTAAKPPASSGGGCGAGPTDLASLLGLVGLAAALRSRRRRG